MEANHQSTSRVFETPDLGDEEDAALGRIEELRRQLRFYVAEPRRWVGVVARVLRAEAIRGSNSIEGFHVSVEDALAALGSEAPTEAAGADWNAVMGYRRAMTYVLQLADDEHFRFSPDLIRGLHFMITEYDLDARPGRWRGGPIWVRNDGTGEVVYEGPEYELVPGLVDGLVLQLEADKGDAMVRGAMAHLNLAMIHPFRDGNGRMARCLQTLVLAREQILAPEWSSIEEYLGVNTADYYRLLAEVGQGAWNPGNDARPWIRFCLEAHFVQASSVLRRVKESEAIFNAVDEIREQHKLHERTLPNLFDAAIGLRLRNASYRSNVEQFEAGDGISHQVATNDLRTLTELGLLEKHGEKRATYYLGAPRLREIAAEVRGGRRPIDASGLFDPAG